MPSHTRSGVGHRIAAARLTRRMTQPQLARAAGISLSMLSKIEVGDRQPSDHLLNALADALVIAPERLTGVGGQTNSRVHDVVPRLRAAINTHDLPEDGPTRPLPELRAAVDTVTQLRVASQYTRLAFDIDESFVGDGGLPMLLNELARTVQNTQGLEQERAAALLALAYRAADGIAFKYGYYDLSNHIIHLMRSLASSSGDPLLEGAVAYVHAETFFASDALPAGLRRLQAAIDTISAGSSIDNNAAQGALHMRAAVTAGRLNIADTAWLHMTEARRLAGDVPEGIYRGTVFGPSSVHVHEVSVAVELGHAAKAIELAQQWSPSRELPAERRSHYYIDLAQAQLWLGGREDAFESLQVARRIAPQHAREHPRVRDALNTLLRRYYAPPEALVRYAEWARAI
jgi:transcriptional regulator with XRE-family HTH domain